MDAFARILDVARPWLRPALVAVSIVLVLSGLSASAGSDPATDCGAAALMEYQSRKIEILTPRNSDSAEEMMKHVISIDGTIAIRRLEEGYCLKFAQCIRKPDDNALTLTLHFNSCIDDEDEERVLETLRLGPTKEMDEFISRLKEE